MTVKEIAEFTGKTERAVRNWIVKASEKSSSVEEKNSSAGHGKIADYTLSEVQAILIAGGMSEMQVSALMQNAHENNQNKNSVNNTCTMNQSQIARFYGKCRSQISRVVKCLYPEKMGINNYQFSPEEIENIKNHLVLAGTNSKGLKDANSPDLLNVIKNQLESGKLAGMTAEEKIAFIRGELAENARAHRTVNPPTRTVRRLVTHANVAEITDGSENHPFN